MVRQQTDAARGGLQIRGFAVPSGGNVIYGESMTMSFGPSPRRGGFAATLGERRRCLQS
jgi:hypothetical protein